MLAEARNDAIAEFNDLAKKYNSSVGEIKKANDVIQQLSKDRADLVAGLVGGVVGGLAGLVSSVLHSPD